mmetsp:Transcript_45036/g.88816  ORF Transcript_45036/g.88816 Transcript_45036/m.88816 type:complete len:105 (-) Transcript_45036:309-623(-)
MGTEGSGEGYRVPGPPPGVRTREGTTGGRTSTSASEADAARWEGDTDSAGDPRRPPCMNRELVSSRAPPIMDRWGGGFRSAKRVAWKGDNRQGSETEREEPVLL